MLVLFRGVLNFIVSKPKRDFKFLWHEGYQLLFCFEDETWLSFQVWTLWLHNHTKDEKIAEQNGEHKSVHHCIWARYATVHYTDRCNTVDHTATDEGFRLPIVGQGCKCKGNKYLWSNKSQFLSSVVGFVSVVVLVMLPLPLLETGSSVQALPI